MDPVEQNGFSEPEPESIAAGLGGLRLAGEGLRYNGPRSGHWTVRSSSFGSAIDDRCPTIHHFGSDCDSLSSHVQSTTRDALRATVQATGDQKKVEDKVARDDKDFIDPVEEQVAQRVGSMRVPKGSHMPTIIERGIRIVSKDGRRVKVIQSPRILSANEVSVLQQTPRMVRITGRNGEEAFVSLPGSVLGSRYVLRAPSATQRSKPMAEMKKEDANNGKAKRQQEQTEAEQMRDERARQERSDRARAHQQRYDKEQAQQQRHDEDRAGMAKTASKTSVPGALQESAKVLSAKHASVHTAKSAGKDSAVAFGGGNIRDAPGTPSKRSMTKKISAASGGKFFDFALKAPSKSKTKDSAVAVDGGLFHDAPKALSMASHAMRTRAPSQAVAEKNASQRSEKAGSMRSRADQSLGRQKVGEDVDYGAGSWKVSTGRAREPWGVGWQEVGEDLDYGAGSRKVSTGRAREPASVAKQEVGNVVDYGVGFRKLSRSRAKEPSSVGRQEFGEVVDHGARSRRPSSGRAKEPSSVGWQEVGAGITQGEAADGSWSPYKPPSFESRSAPRLRSHHSLLHGARHSEEHQQDTSEQRTVRNSAGSATPVSRQSARSPPEGPPTVYAGRGWISPHPLSIAPSEFEEPPDPAIRLPSRDGWDQDATMTYDQWKAVHRETSPVQEAGRRNFSRTTSGVQSRVAGDWGFRTMHPAPGRGVRGWSNNYHGPTVESYHSPSSRNSGAHESQVPMAASRSPRDNKRSTSFEDPWKPPPQFDGVSDGGRTEEGVTAYERRLQDIISQYTARHQQYMSGSPAPSNSWKDV